jgi:hypothetical protein
MKSEHSEKAHHPQSDSGLFAPLLLKTLTVMGCFVAEYIQHSLRLARPGKTIVRYSYHPVNFR